MKILLVDDETLARQRLRRLLEDAEGAHQVVGEAANGVEAVDACQRLAPDLVLLDIRMPGMDGLEAARHLLELPEPPAVIFCTAYEEHAIQAFDLQAVGYLLKPVRRDNLLAALASTQRLNRVQLATLREQEAGRRSHIAARTHKGLELIPLENVRYFQADQKYVTVRFTEGEVIVDDTLRELEEEFGDLFVRVHRNALVARRTIEALVKDADGQVRLKLADIEETVDVSRRHLPSVRKTLKNL